MRYRCKITADYEFVINDPEVAAKFNAETREHKETLVKNLLQTKFEYLNEGCPDKLTVIDCDMEG